MRKYSLENWENLFWTDCGQERQKKTSDCLDHLISAPNLAVKHSHRGDGWLLRFRRAFEEEKLQQWQQLLHEIEDTLALVRNLTWSPSPLIHRVFL
jgi:hypothetical protein